MSRVLVVRGSRGAVHLYDRTGGRVFYTFPSDDDEQDVLAVLPRLISAAIDEHFHEPPQQSEVSDIAEEAFRALMRQ